MKRGKRLTALFLAILLLATSDTGIYEVLGMDEGQSQAADTDKAGGDQAAEDNTGEKKQENGPAVPDAGQNLLERQNTEDGADDKNSPGPSQSSSFSNTLPSQQNRTALADARETVQKFEVSAYLNGNAATKETSIPSGDTFEYSIGYNVPAIGSGASFNAISVDIALPEHLSVSADNGQAWKIAVKGQDVQSARVAKKAEDGLNHLTITLKTGLTAGKGNDVSILFRTDNFEIHNGTQFRLDPQVTGNAGGLEVKGNIEKEADRPVVTVTANDGWKVEKSINQATDVQTSDNGASYTATYTINVNSTKATFNSKGRMAVTGYLLTDILPASASGQNPYAGYPSGGQPYEVTKVVMGERELLKGTDYTVTESGGTATDIQIKEYEKASAADVNDYQFITEGSMMPTTYKVTVKYHRAPYIVASNKPVTDETKWNLANTARLQYDFLNVPQEPSEAQAVIKLGENEDGGNPQSLTIDKYLQIGTDPEFKLDEGAQNKFHTGRIGFRLYDEDGNLATDIKGGVLKDALEEPLSDSTAFVGIDGSARFANLRHGIYYLEEIAEAGSGILVPSGSRIKVELKDNGAPDNGTVTILSAGSYSASLSAGRLKVINQTDKYGMVQFYKYGKNSAGVTEPLGGVVFALYKNGAKVADAVSGKDGKVLFYGVEAGIYDVREVQNPDPDYSLPSASADAVIGSVEVKAGQISAPVFPSGGTTPPLNQGYLNVSPKGQFKIRKVDQADRSLIASPATFQVYGPFETRPEVGGLKGVPAEWANLQLKNENGSPYELATSNGMATSKALDAGYYVLAETKEPEHYAKTGNGMTVVQVTANSDAASIDISNVKKVKVRFLKEGRVGNAVVTDGSLLTGAEFEIWDKQSGGVCLYGGSSGNLAGTMGPALVTKQDATGKPVTDDVWLAPGTYYYIETKAPAGYQLPAQNARRELILDGTNETVEVTVVNTTDYGRIKIHKTDSRTGNAVKGAKFRLYTDAACSAEAKGPDGAFAGVLQTGEDGYAYSPLLEAGKTYWIKETEAPQGYAVKAEVSEIALGANEEALAAIADDPLVTLEIKKTDAVTNELISSEATFRLKNSGGDWVGSAVQTKNGVARFPGLTPGKTYSVYEMKAPAGYTGVDAVNGTLAGTITLPEIAGENYVAGLVHTVEASNIPLGTLKIKKTTDYDQPAGGSAALSGVVFWLYKKTGENPQTDCVAENLTGKKTTDGGGNAVWENLVPGDYWLMEEKAAGHALMNPTAVTVSPGQNKPGYNQDKIETIKNTANQGKVEIGKVDEDGNAPLAGVTFFIYKEEKGLSDYSGKDVVAEITTEAGKSAASGWLEPGDYVLVEQPLPDRLSNYERDVTPHKFTITAGQTNRTYVTKPITNRKMGKLFVDKHAFFTVAGTGGQVRYPLSGAKIAVYPCTGDANKEADLNKTPVEGPVTMTGASWSSRLLPAGDYWVEEVEAPEGYKLQGTKETSASGDMNIRLQNAYKATVTSGVTEKLGGNKAAIDNSTDQGKLRLHKKSASGTPLQGAEFTIYKEVPEAEYKVFIGKKTELTVSGRKVYLIEARVSESSDQTGSMMQTDHKGTAATTTLKAGDAYWFQETKAPQGYYMKQEWHGPYTVEEGTETVAEILNYPDKEIQGEKTDSITSQKLSGAYIAVFTAEADAKNVSEKFIAKGYETDTTKRSALRKELDKKVKDANYQFTGDYADLGLNKVLQIAVSGPNGFAFKNLPPGTYYAAEVLPPDGYAYSSNTYIFTLTADPASGEVSLTAPLSIANEPMGRLEVSKTMNIGGTQYPVSGVKYHIYKADEEGNKQGGIIASGFTAENGIYTSILLPEGKYVVEEAEEEEYTDPKHPAPDVILIGSKDRDMTPQSGNYLLEVRKGETNKATDAAGALLADHKFTNTATVGQFTLQKKLDNNGYVNAGAVDVTFQLEKKDKAGNYQSAGTTKLTVAKGKDASEIYLSDFLPAGEYRLSESGSIPGYTQNNEKVEFEIRAGKITGMDAGRTVIYGTSKDQPIIFTNHHKGYLKIEKNRRYVKEDGALTEAALGGVTFQLYKRTSENAAQDCASGKLLLSGTTNGSGRIDWTLDAGSYWLAETSAGSEEYETPGIAKAEKITIEVGKTVNMTGSEKIVNDSLYGRFKVKKTDANDASLGLKGAEFELYTKDGNFYKNYKDKNGRNIKLTSGADGTFVSGLLPAGDYYLRETKAPQGYEAPASDRYYGPYAVTKQTLTDNTGNAGGQIANRKLFEIQVEKVAAADGIPLYGAEFGLYATENDAKSGENRLQTSKTQKKSFGGRDRAVAAFTGIVLADADGKPVNSKVFYVRETAAPAVNGEAYLLNDAVYPVTVAYRKDSASVMLTPAIRDDRLGKVKIKKEGAWTGADGTTGKEALSGAQFELYKVSDNGVMPAVGAAADDSVVTGSNGTAFSKPLPAGWYALLEVKAPAGYEKTEAVCWVQVEDNKISDQYYNRPIQNGAVSGKFSLVKYDGDRNKPESELTKLTGAVFHLYVKNNKGEYVRYGDDNEHTFKVDENGYTSWYLPYGNYMIQEDQQNSKPYYRYNAGGEWITISCAPGDEKIYFTVDQSNAGTTQSFAAYNSPKGAIRLTKYGDANNNGSIDAADEKLSGATFRLYRDEACTQEAKGGKSLVSADASGVCLWEDLEPGIYYIKETEDGKNSVESAGYLVGTEAVKAEVPSGQTIKKIMADPAVMTVDIQMLDASGAGKLRVKKTDEAGNALAGAEFKIYRQQGSSWIDTNQTVTTTASPEGALSGLLTASPSGTKYKVAETKAPDGYTLDGRFHDLEQEVTVTPTHVPDVSANVAAFTNKESGGIQSFRTDIHKNIKDDDEDYQDARTVASARSLMEEGYSYTADFKVDGYTDGRNEVGASEFVITDNNIELYSKATKDEALNDYGKMDVTADPTGRYILDYRMNSITVGRSWNDSALNKNIADQTVGAEIYVQTTLSEKQNNRWPDEPYQVIDSLDAKDGVVVSFGENEHVIGVKVSYTNVLAGFNSDGIIINTTFLNRSWSTEKISELRQVSNQAQIHWKDQLLDEHGTGGKAHTGNADSETVYAKIPSYIAKLPKVKIQNTIQANQTGGYYAGDNIKYQVTVTNTDEKGQDQEFKDPVVSVRMPADTSLIKSTASLRSGFNVYYIDRDTNMPVQVSPDQFDIVETDGVRPFTSIDANGSYVENKNKETKQYTFMFRRFSLREGEQLFIDFGGAISYGKKDDGEKLICPAYLSSSYTLPQSKENPKGLSYGAAADNSAPTEEPVIDNAVDKNLEYLNQPTEAPVTSATSVQLVKEISPDKTNWSSSTNVNAGDQVYYRLTLYNNSSNTLSDIRLTDILPFPGDSMTLSGDGRGTDIPAADADHDEMTLARVEPASASGIEASTAIPTVYYYKEGAADENSWKNRDAGKLEAEKDGALKMLYQNTGRKDEWSSAGWTTEKPQERNISAVGLDIAFPGGLKEGDSYEVILVMNTPEYRVDQISEYNGKIMANTAASAVVKWEANPGAIGPESRTEPNKVICSLNLPTGSIGDYVWFDENQDGIQNDRVDADGKPHDYGLNGITASLYQKVTYRANGQIQTRDVKLKTTETKSRQVTGKDGSQAEKKGYYEFTDLPCNYLESGKTDQTNPDNYIGNEFYSYYVKFTLPDEKNYTATVRYAGGDPTDETDSNIKPDGTTDPLDLWVSKDERTNKLYGEHRTDIDAGLVNAYAIGDYVWSDANCNGVQDNGEGGVRGVSVRLYKVENADAGVKDGDVPSASTVTDENGYYLFSDLLQGYYVVEFDTTTLTRETNESGYTYQYDYTVVKKADGAGALAEYRLENNSDSDAWETVKKPDGSILGDGRIRRTRTIRLSKNVLNEAGITNNLDDRWDAGLVEYSGLGGICFDDQDYNDLHPDGVNIPDVALAGTKVQLYKVNAQGERETQPIAETTVGTDGRYYFDHLLIADGTYQDYAVKFTYPQGYQGVAGNADPQGDAGAYDAKTGNDSRKDSDVNEFEMMGGTTNRTVGYIRQIRLYPAMISTTWDAGARKYSAIGDYVWLDANKNGLQDRTEKPVANVRVVLQSQDKSGSDWSFAGETITDDNGYYVFRSLESSPYINTQYRVVFALERTRKVTTLNVAEGNRGSTNDSDAIGIYEDGIIEGTALNPQSTGGYKTAPVKPGYGEEDMTWDAGIIPVISALGDYVWYDDDYNGIQDEGEKGVPNTKVSLEYNDSGHTGDSSAWKEIRSTYTDEEGHYWFADLNPGYYRVRFYVPEGYRCTRYNRGEGTEGYKIDSDASRSGEENSWYSRHFYLEEDVEDPTWDAGIYKPNRTTVRRTIPRTVTRRRTAARTGDLADIALWTALAASAGAALVIYTKRRKKKNYK